MSGHEGFIRRVYEEFNAGKFESADELLTEDFVYDDTRRRMDGAVAHGRDAARRHWEQIPEPWEGNFRVDLEDVIDVSPDVAVSVMRVSGRGPASGIEVNAQVAQLWRFREHKLAELTYFNDVEEALAAARG